MKHRRPTKNRDSDLEPDPDCLHRNRTSWRMKHRRPTKNRGPDLEPDCLHRNRTSWRMTHRRPTKNRDPDLEPDCLHRNRSSWRMTHRRPTKNRDPDLEPLGWNQEQLVSLAGSRNLSAWLDPGTCQEPELDWNSKGRTVQNNTPCCGSRPPAYPSFSTDGHVF